MVWPFTRRQRSTPAPTDRVALTGAAPPLPEKSRARRRTSKASIRSNQRRALRDLEKTQEPMPNDEKAQMLRRDAANKENAAPARLRSKGSIEDITALPISWKLQQSPHLRAADATKPQIPYNFRNHATSRTSVQGTPSRPATLKSKRSTFEATPQRKSSRKRKGDDRIREEEIRAMSASSPISKPQGDSIMRRDSRKRRNLAGMKDSNVSLPMEDSIHSAMSNGTDQRGWEVGSFAAFSPRPAIRLSGAAQYASPLSEKLRSPLSRDGNMTVRDKRPFTRESTRKRIGDEVDDLDSSDIRVLLERDAKRREKRKKEQQEKLDRKLRARAGRERGDSDKKKREAEELRRQQSTRQRVEEETRARGLVTAPMAVHPALREENVFDDEHAVGLGIGEDHAEQAPENLHDEHALSTTEELGTENTGTLLDYSVANPAVENPFADPVHSIPEDAEPKAIHLAMPEAFSPVQTPMEDPIVETAREMRMSFTSTPPMSPIRSRDMVLPMSPLSVERRNERTASLPEPPPIPASLQERRTSDQSQRRAGAWATFFRRGGTNLKKTEDARSSTSGSSFKNTSRDSASRGPIPAHLLGNEPSPFQRRKSGTPTRTQSRFREDLPEMPMSPPDSRVQSPEVPDMPAGAAAIAAARKRLEGGKPSNVSDSIRTESDHDPSAAIRYDTPVGPSRIPMSASLASVDSEGSWLASGGSLKRSSDQSRLSRDMGSLSKRRADFTASYEELGIDKDAEYVRRGKTPSPSASRSGLDARGPSAPTAPGAEVIDAPKIGDTVHRTPTLVHRDNVNRSREGLLTEFTDTKSEVGEDEIEPDSPVGDLAELQSARSVQYGGGKGGHARHLSAGSAKLLDVVPSRRASLSPAGREREA
nr:hypothetical protein B0A51_17647 [Rachicladosporium sp. CCFEE 5018]